MHRQLKLRQVTHEEYKVWLCRGGQGGAGTEPDKVGKSKRKGFYRPNNQKRKVKGVSP